MLIVRSYDDSMLSIMMACIGPKMQVVAENSGRIMSSVSTSLSKSAFEVTPVTQRFPKDGFTPGEKAESFYLCQSQKHVTNSLHEYSVSYERSPD
jgi:hypothetical protein